ncbi:protein kinase domain-containing protein [Leptolyngbya sp. GGD]|uniref:protein kinase domain-containing protein n=1 Tax=Leptolyngbya sp. GGD TaxID=2997907 RepID=UPI00227D3D7E|nr:protein kinase [Leptolyngbya sp. GGD]MCY6493916.1 protein kinase [Leptolyngbya sp. GGD]
MMSVCLHPHCTEPQNPDNQRACRSCGAKLLIKSRYRALQPIKMGKFIRTFKGVDTAFSANAPIQLKQILLPDEILKNSANRQRAIEIFKQSVAALHTLKDVPNLQTPIDYSVVGNGLYLIEALPHGSTLSELLQNQSYLTESQIQKLLEDLLPALQTLHESSLLHRDIQPEHILYSHHSGTFTLINFGFPQLIAEMMQNSILKAGEYLIGDPAYSAQEQLTGKATFASDLYSLGVVCLQAATGIEPTYLLDYQGKHWNYQDYLTHNSLSPAFCKILEQMAAPSLLDRYANIELLLKDLRHQDASAAEQPVTQLSSQQAAEKAIHWLVNAALPSFNAVQEKAIHIANQFSKPK